MILRTKSPCHYSVCSSLPRSTLRLHFHSRYVLDLCMWRTKGCFISDLDMKLPLYWPWPREPTCWLSVIAECILDRCLTGISREHPYWPLNGGWFEARSEGIKKRFKMNRSCSAHGMYITIALVKNPRSNPQNQKSCYHLHILVSVLLPT